MFSDTSCPLRPSFVGRRAEQSRGEEGCDIGPLAVSRPASIMVINITLCKFHKWTPRYSVCVQKCHILIKSHPEECTLSLHPHQSNPSPRSNRLPRLHQHLFHHHLTAAITIIRHTNINLQLHRLQNHHHRIPPNHIPFLDLHLPDIRIHGRLNQLHPWVP